MNFILILKHFFLIKKLNAGSEPTNYYDGKVPLNDLPIVGVAVCSAELVDISYKFYI